MVVFCNKISSKKYSWLCCILMLTGVYQQNNQHITMMETKNYKTTFLKKGVIILLAVSALTACKKKDDNTPEPDQKARLAILVSSPGAGELLFYNNGKKTATTNALNFNTVINYFAVEPGTGEFGFSKKDSEIIFAKVNYDLKAATHHSLIFTGKFPESEVILVEDDRSAPATDKAKIRFANLSPDVPALDLYMQGKTDPGLSNKAFKAVSGFVNVDPAANPKFEIKTAGGTTVLATLENFKIEKGKIYTIWVRGLIDAGDGPKLGIEAMTN